jgi:hypothetical protein
MFFLYTVVFPVDVPQYVSGLFNDVVSSSESELHHLVMREQ